MKIDADLIMAMAKAGVTVEQIAIIAREYSAATAETRAKEREQNRIRQINHRARNAASRVTERDTPALDKEIPPTPPKEIKPSPISRAKALVSDRDFFAEFWLAFPRREGSNPRKPAKLIFERLLAKGANPERIIEAAKLLASESPSPTRFIPQAQTWLNQERFGDEAPVIAGDEFCPDEWPNTRFLKIRFRDERGHDPPSMVNGGKTGVLIPAEWVTASRLASNGKQTAHRSTEIRREGQGTPEADGDQERRLSDSGQGSAPHAVAGLARLLSMERDDGFGRSDGWRKYDQDGPEPVPIRLRS